MTGVFLNDRPEDQDFLNLSVSKVKTFKDCKLKFKFAYIEKLPKKDWEHLKFGSFLHEVLENFHNYLLAEPNSPFNVLMKTAYQNALKNWDLTTEVKKEAFEILCGYLKQLAEQQRNNTLPIFLNLEKTFYINIADKILIHGFIDRIQRDPDGVLHVGDYKSSKKKKYLENDHFQLLTYAYAMCLEDPELQKVRTSYIMLRHNFDLIEREYDRSQIMKMEEVFLKHAEDIEAEKLYRPKSSPLCKYCDYLELCKDGQDFVKRNNKEKPAKMTPGFVDW